MWAIAAATAALATAILAHFVATRLHAKRVAGYGFSLLGGIVTAGLLTVLLASEGETDFLAPGLLFASWWFIFLNFVQTSQSSLRVSVLRELQQGGGISRAALQERYNNRALVLLRLNRLLSAGAVVERNGSYFVKSGSLKFLARFFRVLKIAILGRPSEFEQGPSR
jgi:hypothetical protein